MGFYKTTTFYEIYKKYPRYTIYSVYSIVYDKDDNKIGVKFLYNTSKPPKSCDIDE